MDIIKALQIVMSAAAAALIKEIYDVSKQSESVAKFLAETLMSTLVGTIIGFVAQSYINDLLVVMGITAASSVQGIKSLDLIPKFLPFLSTDAEKDKNEDKSEANEK